MGGQIASPPLFVQLQELHTLSGDRAKYLDEITQETLGKGGYFARLFRTFGFGNFIDRIAWITRTHDYVFYFRIVDNWWSFAASHLKQIMLLIFLHIWCWICIYDI